MATSEEHGKPRVLILGGTGFIGRNLVTYLVENNLASKVRVADKVPPVLAWLNQKHKEIFENPVVEFKQSSLISPASVSSAFTDPEGEYDFVINLAAETKYGQTDAVYQEGIVNLSLNCAREAAKHNPKVFVEFSTGQVYAADKKPAKEDSKLDPWTVLAKHKLEVEKQLRNIPGLNYLVVRPVIVYGPGDKMGLAPRLIIGAIYKYTRQKMKMLWTKDLQMNTVHVIDVCRAVWHLCNHGKKGEVYNIVDNSHTTQGKVSELVSEIYDIKYDFMGSVLSNIARVNMTSVVEDINDRHVQPWADACERDGIVNTPLNPFIDQELLYNKNLAMSSSKLTATGFTYSIPELKIESLKEILDDYIKSGLFPRSLLSAEMLWNGNDIDETEEILPEQNEPEEILSEQNEVQDS
ncbi:probable dTDP-glucose 4,6-dehydratase [Saccostrea cucullata]|uniref:probable dTDP-glucose 4,6-dehydratase n=1 Tax=Saccostrea cuccullata TaxID=36930 RepID=UPI002ED04350